MKLALPFKPLSDTILYFDLVAFYVPDPSLRQSAESSNDSLKLLSFRQKRRSMMEFRERKARKEEENRRKEKRR